MQSISKLSPDLLAILTEFSDFFFNRDYSRLESMITLDPSSLKVAIKGMNREATSEEYLKKALVEGAVKYGFPRHSWGLELSHHRRYIDDRELLERAAETNGELMEFFGARNNALQMFYPRGGYIGWHNNCNAPGYNIVLSCNPEAKGYFQHYDHDSGVFNTYKDAPGWNCKVGYFGSDKEPDKIFWHCAYTDSPRLTLSYVIYDENLWRDMVDDIDAG